MGWALALVLLAFVAAHLALVGGLARRGLWGTALLSLVVPPLAPWSGWRCRMRARSVAWWGALGLYVLGFVVARV